MSLDPIIATQDTVQNTTSSTMVDVSGSATTALANGVVYWVRYYGNCGSDGSNNRPEMQLLFGSTVYGYASGEGRGTSNNFDSAQCQGYIKITGDGTSTLKFQHAAQGGTTYTGAMCIVAMPLTDGTENTDWFYDGADGSGWEQSNVSTSWTTLRSKAWTLNSEDYIIMMSAECRASPAGSNSEAWRTRYYVDSTELTPMASGVGHNQEWENDADLDNVSIATVETMTSGSRTFKIECASRGAAESHYRRSRIWLFRKDFFDQVVQTRDTTGATTTSGTYVDFSGLDTTYTPNQTEYVMILGHVVMGHSTLNTVCAQLYDNTGSQAYRVDSGEYNNDNGFDANRCGVPTVLSHCQQQTGAVAWKVQWRRNSSGTGAIGKNRSNTAGVQSNLIFIGLTKKAVSAENAAGQLGCNT